MTADDEPTPADPTPDAGPDTGDTDPTPPAAVLHADAPAADEPPPAEAEPETPPEPAAEGAPTDEDAAAPVEAAAEPASDGQAAAAEPPPPESKKKWYIIKVTSGREESIKAAIERRVKIEGLEEYFGQVYIPVEKVVEVKKVKETKNGEKITKEKRVTKERKKFPGYVMAEVEFNDQILYLFRETSGVGDFVGAGGPGKVPPPMAEIDVKRMLGEAVPAGPGGTDAKGNKIKVKLDFEKGDRVRIREGAFSNMEGEVKLITEPKEAGETPKVQVIVTIFGRPVDVELDYWQVDKL